MPPPEPSARRRHLLWLLALALGLALRLWFLQHPMPLDDDTGVYAELATNLFHHHVYGLANDAGTLTPTLIRLPGYPIFLGILFALFGAGNFTVVLLTQIAFDLLACYLIACFIRDEVSPRAGTIALFLAALCPFTAAYTTIALTESLSVFAVALALYSTGRLLRSTHTKPDPAALILTSTSAALAMLLRPDGILLTASILLAILIHTRRLKLALITLTLAALPLVPWTIRNAITFHTLQPLAPRRVNDPGERVNYGFYRWMSTWAIDIVSTGNVFWNVGTAPIDINDLPTRAFDSPTQRATTADLLVTYNTTNTITPALDAQFDALALQRFHQHLLLTRIEVPTLRVLDMFLRPRTETLNLDADWWRFSAHYQESYEACALGLLNFILIGAALTALIRRQVPWQAFPIAYLLLRSILISTMENSEPRYTLEAFPILLAAAAITLSRQEPSNE